MNVSVCVPPFCFRMPSGFRRLGILVAIPPSTGDWRLARADTLIFSTLLYSSWLRDCTGSCRVTVLSVLRCLQVSDLEKMLGSRCRLLDFTCWQKREETR